MKLLNINSYSLNTKVAITLFILAIFLLVILFILIIPKMQKEQLEYTKSKINKITLVTKEQLKIASKAIGIQAELEKSETKYKLELDFKNIKKNAKNLKNTIRLINKSSINKHCNYLLENKEQKITTVEDNNYFRSLKNTGKNKWQLNELFSTYRTLERKKKYLSYSTKLSFKNTTFTIFCDIGEMNKNHESFEKDIKINIQKTFELTQKLHKGKTYFMWINPKYMNEDNKPLYEKNSKLGEKKYLISKLSNVDNIYTGDLTAKQIIQAKDKKPILHNLNGKKALTWIKDLSTKDSNYIALLITTVNLKDLYGNQDSIFWKILPASIIALLLAICVAFFIFKKLFRTINTLTHTAKEINKGNKTIRSKVKGSDDIGSLGIAFDNMIDKFEDSINLLDSKVDEKTSELKSSLKEKEILLKEIHHRVKNNLALTISLIKLQQAKIEDKNTKKILTDIQERVYTMELLHRKLYESTNLDSINFKDYIPSLAKDISKTYNYENEVLLDIEVENIYLDIEKAIPCGLIINEIITNSFKYAFKNNPSPKLSIQMKNINNSYELTIKDNGKGIDENINIYTSSSLGLKLINSISKLQLKGVLDYKNEKGAVFKVSFN